MDDLTTSKSNSDGNYQSEVYYIQPVLYVRSQQSTVRWRKGQVVVEEPSSEGVLTSVPKKHLEMINIFGRVEVTSGLLSGAASEDILVNHMTRSGRFRGRYEPAGETPVSLRRKQYTLSGKRKFDLSCSLVRRKIRSQSSVMHNYECRGLARRIHSIASTLDDVSSWRQLRAREANASRLFFRGFSRQVPDPWKFKKRSRRPPGDPVNSLLSLTYTMLLNEVCSVLRRCRLDPYPGVFHVERSGRPALALDLLDPLRAPFGGEFVLDILGSDTFQPDDFNDDNRLQDPAFQKYLELLEAWLEEPPPSDSRPRRVLIEDSAHDLREAINDPEAKLSREPVVGKVD